MITWPELRFPPINLWNAPGYRARATLRRVKPATRRTRRVSPQSRIEALLARR